jgi:hypothetical protein
MVGVTGGEQPIRRLPVVVEALRLEIGPVRTAQVRSLVVGEAGPAEGLDQLLDRPGDQTGPIGVFDAEDVGAAVAAGEEVVVESGAQPSDMEVAGWARRKADADLLGH